MAHQVLARKWRPRNFADVVGQDHVIRALANALDTGRIHHAYLFTGTRGVGKTTLARILAKALNCETGLTSTPCGRCKACEDIDAGRFVDLLEVDAATNTKVDEMRELLETAQYAPVSGRYKVYIIDEVHMLSKSAFNAMLKTLEEPPGHVEFILATTDPQRLPITVLSRCLQFNLKNLSPGLLTAHLSKILDAETIPHEKPALDMISRAAEGSARDALSLLDQAIAYGAGEVKTEAVAGMLGALDQTYLRTLLAAVADHDPRGLLAEIDRIAARSISFDTTLKELAALLARVAIAQRTPATGEGADGPIAAELARRFDAEQVQLMYQIALLGRRDLPFAPDEAAGFTMTMLRMLGFAAGNAARPIDAPPARQDATPAPSPAAAVASNRDALPAAGTPSVIDWPKFVSSAELSGLAGMLAKQCEFVSFEGGLLELMLPAAQKHLAEKNYQEKLRSELAASLGSAVRLNVRLGEATGNSLAARESREREEREVAARQAIDSDPFVASLRKDFGAEVLKDSIRPRDGGR